MPRSWKQVVRGRGADRVAAGGEEGAVAGEGRGIAGDIHESAVARVGYAVDEFGSDALARRVAAAVGAVPVITTATDSGGLFSPDIFAKANGLVICGMSEAKAVAAALVNGETVGVKCAYPHSAFPPELEERGSGSIGIVISDSDDEKPFDITLNLIPKNLAVVIGCKKDISAAAVTEHIMRTFSENRLDIRRLSICATIDIKAEEKGLKRFCDMFGLPLGTYTAEELMEAKGEFAHSGFVEKTVGADNVCERAAVCAGGTLIVGKTKGNGVTCAVSELPVYIDPESGE